MRWQLLAGLALAAAISAPLPHAAAADPPDPFMWLEDVNGPRAMGWVRAENAATLARLQADRRYRGFFDTALALAQDPDRIPTPHSIGGQIYNLWQDAAHAQGLWRRTTPAEFRSAAPHWTTVLDLDALSRAEGHRWVWKGVTCWRPEDRRCLISLSDGGEDAVTTREFDLPAARFVDDGFVLPRSKMTVDWLDRDTILLGTDWGPGSLTDAGYPFVVKRLRRGQTLAEAQTYYRGDRRDVGVELIGLLDGAGRHAVLLRRELDFFRTQTLLAAAAGPRPLPLPEKLSIEGLVRGALIVTLNEPVATQGVALPTGSLAALDLDRTGQGLHLIYAPGPRQSIEDAATSADRVIAAVYDNVRGRAMVFTPAKAGWSARILKLPDNASVSLVDAQPLNDRVFLGVTSFLQPPALYAADLGGTAAPAIVKSLPARFDASAEVVEQREAISTDGAKIPYFLVHPGSMQPSGNNPTILYAYGGFQISMTPTYSATLGKLWLERGGVYALANIRGGGEFGPSWHEAGLKTHRQLIYDDFSAVARDLIARRVTDSRHLGIRGGSNGGLLMGVQFVQHPELYRAVAIEVPLLDMLRYEKIAAGASWAGEYGSVANPAERAFLARISPYANLRAGVAYPEPFIFTTTKDDRVGPVHARKFAARLQALHRPYYYYEAVEGGHAAGANLRQAARQQALEMTYFTRQLMPD